MGVCENVSCPAYLVCRTQERACLIHCASCHEVFLSDGNACVAVPGGQVDECPDGGDSLCLECWEWIEERDAAEEAYKEDEARKETEEEGGDPWCPPAKDDRYGWE